MAPHSLPLILILAAGLSGARIQDDKDVEDVAAQDLKADGDANKRYFLIGPRKEAKPPAKGFGLLVVLPGGDGSADFHAFVKRIYKNAAPDGFLIAELVAVKWTKKQDTVWPTEKLPVEKMKFTTEEFIEAVIEEVSKKNKIDSEKVFTLSWSSGGQAAYIASLRKKKLITGSFVAMSVFRPQWLPSLAPAKGHCYYLFHSPDDKVCEFHFAEDARDALKKNGATVELKTYDGGHGWHGDVYGGIRAGLEWLEKNHAKPGGK